MARKTYAPQLARLLQHVALYYTRHKAKIDPTIAGQGSLTADIQTIVTTINNAGGWGSIATRENP